MKKTSLALAALLTAAVCTVASTPALAGTPVPPPTSGQAVSGVEKATGNKPLFHKPNNNPHPNTIQNPPPWVNFQFTQSPVFMYESAVLGPVRTSTNFPAWASNMINTVYWDGAPITSSNSWTHPYRLGASDLSQSPDATNNTLWFVIHIRSLTTNYMFSVSNLWFTENSSDPANSLAKTNWFNDPSYAFSPWGMGIVWNGYGPRVSDTIYDNASGGPWNGQLVNELIFIGAQSTYFNADTNQVGTYINGFSATNVGFSVTGKWLLNYGNGTNYAMSAVTLQTQGSPRIPVITVNGGTPNLGTNVIVGVNEDAGHTLILRYYNNILGLWKATDMATLNPGEVVNLPTDDSHQTFKVGFFPPSPLEQ